MGFVKRLCLLAFLITAALMSASAQKAAAPDVLLTVGGEVSMHFLNSNLHQTTV